MSEPLDNELRKRISEVFDNYEDTAPAEAGWQLLREKLPLEKKRRMAPIWWSAAATLLILCLFGLWFYNEPQKADQSFVKTQRKPRTTKDSISRTNITPEEIAQYRAAAKDSAQKQYADLQKHNLGPVKRNNFANGNKLSTSPTSVPAPDKHLNEPDKLAQQPVSGNSLRYNEGLVNEKQLNKTTNTAIALVPVKKPDSLQTVSSNILAAQQNNVPTHSNKINAVDIKDSADVSKSAMSVYLANEQNKGAGKNAKDNNSPADKKVLYSVYAATYFNYAEGSKSQINTGAGFTTDIKLAGNFKLSTGIAIGKNTLNYNGQPAKTGILNEAIGVSRAKASDYPAASAAPVLGFVGQRVAPDPVVTGYNVSLTGLDVPVNIKYEFNPKKSDSYISAGLSSGTFITETYRYQYDNSANVLGFSPEIPDASTRKSFTQFGFGRMLNISMGIGYQITSSNRLVIEPFFNYPLSGLGSQQIRFGAGGINLRLKFQGAKK
ncbi:hypothetical protein ABDD95_09570 [Mucilaginibacter sp. PAMB04274]|uniref:hypothetical protein n=1 Tax=Mucilaginibacter sp. PAMB04274 TaxID=3138568 RepID=UPI0031F64240